MRVLSRIAGALGEISLGVAAVGILASVLVGTADIVGTHFFLAPVHGATEGTTELMVGIVFLSLGAVERARAHIRVELLYARLGVRTRAILDAVSSLAALVFFGVLFWQGLEAATFSWRIGERTLSVVRIPIYPAKFAILAGVGVLMMQLLVHLAERTRDALSRAPREGPGSPAP